MKKFFQNKIAVSSIVGLMVIAIIILIFSLVNAKYTSSFNSHIDLLSDPPVVDKFYIIADPYECHTSSTDPTETGTYTHFGYYDPDGEDPYAHLTYVEGLEPGNTVSINNTIPTSPQTLLGSGQYYSLRFPDASSIHYAGSETASGNVFGAVDNWYDLKWNSTLPVPDPGNDPDTARWVDNRNYMFDTYARRWAFAPTTAVSFVDGEWVINESDPNFYIINPSTPFSVPTGATSGFFIAYFDAHWNSEGFSLKPEPWKYYELPNGGTFAHWDRFNVNYARNQEGKIISEPDPIWFEAKSGTNETDPKLFVGQEGVNVAINDWTYRYFLQFDYYSATTGGSNRPCICLHNPDHKRIRSLGLALKVNTSSTQNPILKIVDHGGEVEHFSCQSFADKENWSKLVILNFSPEQTADLSNQEALDIFINGDGASGINIYGLYVDWFSLYEFPDYNSYWNGMRIPRIVGEDIIDIGTPQYSNVKLVSNHSYNSLDTNLDKLLCIGNNYDMTSLWMKDRYMLSLNWVKKLRSFSIIQ